MKYRYLYPYISLYSTNINIYIYIYPDSTTFSQIMSLLPGSQLGNKGLTQRDIPEACKI